MPRETSAKRTLVNLLCFVQWPIGVAIYVVPHSVAAPLVFARFAFFVASFALLAWIYGRGQMRLNSLPAAGGSGVPA